MYCGFRELLIICDINAKERPCCSISFSSRKHSLVFSGGTSKTIVICESEATTTPNRLKHLGQVTTNPPKLNSSSAIFSRSTCIKSPLTSSVPHFRQRISFNSSHLQHFSPRNPLRLKFCKRALLKARSFIFFTFLELHEPNHPITGIRGNNEPPSETAVWAVYFAFFDSVKLH